MPARSAKKRAKRSISPAVSSLIDDEQMTPLPDALPIAGDVEASEEDATDASDSNDELVAEGEDTPSHPAVKEDKAVKTEETKLVAIADRFVEEDVPKAREELYSNGLDEASAPKERVDLIGEPLDAEKVIVMVKPVVQSQSQCEEILEDQETELEDKEGRTLEEKMNMDEGNFVKDAEGGGGGHNSTSDDDGDNDNDDDGVDNQENEDNNYSLYMQASLMEGKTRKGSEIFVGGLNNAAVEDDLVKVFGVFGDIQSVRIVRNPVTQKSRRFAFIRFAAYEHAMKALDVLKFGTEVNGKRVRVKAGHDNTIYLGNICKAWVKEHVLEKLKSLGVEQVENLILPEDPVNEGKNKGFAYLEFSTHSDAEDAFQLLRKPDALFGLDKTARFAFVRTTLNANEEMMLQVKTVYLKAIPPFWDEQKVREYCEVYGEIERIELSQNFSSRKRRDFGFVEFSSRESALACVEGINNLQLGDGDAKVRADLAKPRNEGHLTKPGVRGGLKVKQNGKAIKEASHSAKKRRSNSIGIAHKVEKKLNSKVAKESKPSTSQNKDSKGKISLQNTTSIKSRKHSRKVIDTSFSQHPSKKMRQNRNYGKSRSHYYARTATSESQLHPSDLAPHAGYLPATKKFNNLIKYDRSTAYNKELSRSSEYGRAIHGMQTSYQSYTKYANYQLGCYQYLNNEGYAPRRSYY